MSCWLCRVWRGPPRPRATGKGTPGREGSLAVPPPPALAPEPAGFLDLTVAMSVGVPLSTLQHFWGQEIWSILRPDCGDAH